MDFLGYMSNPDHCPNCKSEDLDVGDETFNIQEDGGTWAIAEITCNDCNMEWKDKYKFLSFEVTRQPDEKEEEEEEESEEANA